MMPSAAHTKLLNDIKAQFGFDPFTSKRAAEILGRGRSLFDQVAHLIADAHADHGEVSAYYDPAAVRLRLNQAWACGARMLGVEKDGIILACGALMPAAFASATQAMCFGATRSDQQGRGLGHTLVEKRIQLAAELGAGTIIVSTKNPARWSRYSFRVENRNPVSGASLMVINLDWRAS